MSFAAVLCFLFAIQTIHSQNNYFVDQHTGCNNVYGDAESKQNTEYVRYLGSYDNSNQCINACVNASKLNDKCLTYTYHTSSFSSDFAKQCFGRFGYPLWVPYNQDNVNCGQIIWNCQSSLDCSLSGLCDKNTGNCSCNTGWKGYRCNELDLLPATKSAGYNQEDNGKHTSSWGGSPIYNSVDQKYNMIVSEMVNHCGMSTWEINSRIIRVEATNGYNSAYQRMEVIEVPFAHEPNINRGNNGEYVIFYDHYDYGSKDPPCTLCKDGSTPNGCKQPNPPHHIAAMIYADELNGTWSEPMTIVCTYGCENGVLTPYDDNFDGVILSDGSLIGMSRYWDNNGCSAQHLVTATNWKLNGTYNEHKEYLFPELSGMCTEDQFLWIDCNGNYHAVFHNMMPMRYIGLDGGHAYSQDGMNWIYGGYSFGDFVEFTDGTSMTLGSRERPHLILDNKDNCTPLALTNGIVYGGGQYGDASRTFLQPIKH